MATAEEIAAAQRTAARKVRGVTDAAVLSLWDGLDNWRDDDIEQFADRAATVVQAGQRQVALFTAASIGQTIRVDQITSEQIRGVPTRDPYLRLGPAIWTSLADRGSLDSAVDAARSRLIKVAAADMQLAKTHAARAAITRPGSDIVGHRRVLVGSTNCVLCIVASTRRYRRGDLAPIHPGCDCDVVEIRRGDRFDKPFIIDEDVMNEGYAAAKRELGVDTTDPAVLRDLVTVREHGELGPVLTVTRHRHRGPGDF